MSTWILIMWLVRTSTDFYVAYLPFFLNQYVTLTTRWQYCQSLDCCLVSLWFESLAACSAVSHDKPAHCGHVDDAITEESAKALIPNRHLKYSCPHRRRKTRGPALFGLKLDREQVLLCSWSRPWRHTGAAYQLSKGNTPESFKQSRETDSVSLLREVRFNPLLHLQDMSARLLSFPHIYTRTALTKRITAAHSVNNKLQGTIFSTLNTLNFTPRLPLPLPFE